VLFIVSLDVVPGLKSDSDQALVVVRGKVKVHTSLWIQLDLLSTAPLVHHNRNVEFVQDHISLHYPDHSCFVIRLLHVGDRACQLKLASLALACLLLLFHRYKILARLQADLI
jgi:hypothetical protein